jgi:hypothetical protein
VFLAIGISFIWADLHWVVQAWFSWNRLRFKKSVE